MKQRKMNLAAFVVAGPVSGHHGGWRYPTADRNLLSLEYYRNVQLSPELEEAAARVQQEVTAEIEAAERELELMRQEGEAEEMAAE